jgi:hypothetical protein
MALRWPMQEQERGPFSSTGPVAVRCLVWSVLPEAERSAGSVIHPARFENTGEPRTRDATILMRGYRRLQLYLLSYLLHMQVIYLNSLIIDILLLNNIKF